MDIVIIINAVIGIITNLAICALITALGVGLYIRNKKTRIMLTRAKNGGRK